MTSPIKERSFITYLILSFITCGIYSIVYWTKLSEEVNVLCEGDGRKTMKYVFVWLLNFVTLGIFGLVWRYQLAQRLRANAARYDLKFSESGALVVVYDVLGLPFLAVGPILARFILVKNFNQMAKSFNAYNGLVDPEEQSESVFAD